MDDLELAIRVAHALKFIGNPLAAPMFDMAARIKLSMGGEVESPPQPERKVERPKLKLV